LHEEPAVKRVALLATLATAVVAAVRSWRSRRADAELWHEATAPRDLR
jgi:hypothetical protein